MKVVEKRTKRTFTLEDISEEEMDMLRTFAAIAADDAVAHLGLALGATLAAAAVRFRKMIEAYESGSYNPAACFNE